jgi:diaminohydroxyphosphoribosylaminopyrimidine deaminase/5-amino-6-(5-phosphoribosylamino)uracil reductase
MSEADHPFMTRALNLAVRGEGRVEPNPMVGAVIVRDGQIVGEGWHQEFGGPHAEIKALNDAGEHARGATLYVTLEPCCHHGKTPPCTDALIQAGIVRVVAALEDPFRQVAGQGFAQLRSAGVHVEVGLGAEGARFLLAPYLQRVSTGRPWVIAKWAMTLDGKVATVTGESKWITGERARGHAHLIRGRVDGILVGVGTVLADDPLLTARAENGKRIGPRLATRIILDHHLRAPPESKLAGTAGATPVLIVHGADADPERKRALAAAGCELLPFSGATPADQLSALLWELGTIRSFTNLLVEGGPRVLASFLEASLVDEVHCYIAPKLLGQAAAPGPFGGAGFARLAEAMGLLIIETLQLGDDLLIRARKRQTPV